MADRIFWIEVDEDTAKHGIDRAQLAIGGKVNRLLEDLARQGVHILQSNVPIYSSYTLRHIDRSQIKWHPGGAGGGGTWETMFGIRAGTSMHPLYANRGTPPYTGSGSEVVTYGRSQPQVVPSRMYFFSKMYGRVIGVRSVEGQQPQLFLYKTFTELRAYVSARLLAR
jgi:hypothetical protein